MESLSENRPLLWSIALSGLAIVGLLTGSSPEFNEQFALVDIPTEVSLYSFGSILGAVLLYYLWSNYAPHVVTWVLFLAVQTYHSPGSGGGLCCCSAGGPCSAVPAWKRNPQAAFLNSVPITTTALINQTVKGEKTLKEEEDYSCCGIHKTAESHGVQYCTLCVSLPSFFPAVTPLNNPWLYCFFSFIYIFTLQLFIVFYKSLFHSTVIRLSRWYTAMKITVLSGACETVCQQAWNRHTKRHSLRELQKCFDVLDSSPWFCKKWKTSPTDL